MKRRTNRGRRRTSLRAVRRNGKIVVQDDTGARKTLSSNQRLFVRGYAITSYGSQGKTVDTVILADSGSKPATSREQWYVSISRARKRAVIVTSDKSALRDQVESSGQRELAIDLIEANAEKESIDQNLSESVKETIEQALHVQRHKQLISLRPKQTQTQGIRIRL